MHRRIVAGSRSLEKTPVHILPSNILSVINCLPAPRDIGYYSNDSNID